MQNLNGTLTFRLRRYLYGLQERNKVLHQTLNQMKLRRSIAGPCAYARQHKDGPLYLIVHVVTCFSPVPDFGSNKTWKVSSNQANNVTSHLTLVRLSRNPKTEYQSIRGVTSITWCRSSKPIQTPSPLHRRQQIS